MAASDELPLESMFLDPDLSSSGAGAVSSVDVCLVLMPYADISRPSLALGILKACLKESGIRCAVEHANLQFAEQLGWGMPDLPYLERLLGEWLFSSAAFPGQPRVSAETLLDSGVAQSAFLPRNAFRDPRLLEALNHLRDFTPSFVESVARQVLKRKPRIVGCSSMFEQHCASLALLRRLKVLDPSLITIMGGANCEGEMGWATLKEFPWIDYVVSGEADELFQPLCRRLLDHGPDLPIASLASGVLARAHVTANAFPAGSGAIPRAAVKLLDNSPIPDYSDYFEALNRSCLRDRIRPGLLAETSRGCWWGQKSQCTFCGLNGGGMAFRVKSPERALREFELLAERYGIPKFMVVDNIIDMGYFKTVLPALAERSSPYKLFYETKANLKRDQVKMLADAGVMWIQPGIEGFDDRLLRLMAKGNSAMINLQLLKYTREFGIYTTWLMLFGFPGEDDGWHQEVADWLPMVFHLQPPKCVGKVLYDRFSVYHQRPDSFGLKLEPAPSYSSVYPLSQESLRELAYFFTDANETPGAPFPPGVRALIRQVVAWSKLHKRALRPLLCMTPEEDRIHFYDTRPCAPARRVTIQGLAARLYLACDPATTRSSLISRFSKEIDGAESKIHQAFDELIEGRLLLEVHGFLLALAIPGGCPTYCDPEDFPGGNAERLDPFTAETLDDFCKRAVRLSPSIEEFLSA